MARSILPLLLVDDEPVLLHTTQRLIQQALPEARVLAFESAKSALDATAREDLGMAMLDVNMPEMSGIELASKLRARQPDLPIAFLTGSFVPNLEELDAVAWLDKPFSAHALIAMVAEHALRAREVG